jgi:transposase-like protein
VSFRVIYHAMVCPECGSADVSTDEVPTGDGITETAYVCDNCHVAWPLACISDLEHQP